LQQGNLALFSFVKKFENVIMLNAYWQ